MIARTVKAGIALLIAMSVATAIRAAPLSLFDWIGVAPIVVAAESLGDDGKLTEFRVLRTFRGPP